MSSQIDSTYASEKKITDIYGGKQDDFYLRQ